MAFAVLAPLPGMFLPSAQIKGRKVPLTTIQAPSPPQIALALGIYAHLHVFLLYFTGAPSPAEANFQACPGFILFPELSRGLGHLRGHALCGAPLLILLLLPPPPRFVPGANSSDAPRPRSPHHS